jgi:hypothetical protein
MTEDEHRLKKPSSSVARKLHGHQAARRDDQLSGFSIAIARQRLGLEEHRRR